MRLEFWTSSHTHPPATLCSALLAQLHIWTNRRCRSFSDLHPGQGFHRQGQRSCCYGDVGERQNSVIRWRTLHGHRGRALTCWNTLRLSWIDQLWPFVSLAQVSTLRSRILFPPLWTFGEETVLFHQVKHRKERRWLWLRAPWWKLRWAVAANLTLRFCVKTLVPVFFSPSFLWTLIHCPQVFSTPLWLDGDSSHLVAALS